MELYIPDPARPYTDGSEALLLSRLPVLLRSRNRIWKNDRRTQCLAFGTAKHPATEYHLFFLWLSSDVLRHLPRQQLHAPDHSNRYLSARSVRDFKKELQNHQDFF